MSDPLRKVVAEVFKVPYESVSDDSTPDTISGWDSMGQLTLVSALEARFGAAIEPEDILEMESVADIRRMLARQGTTLAPEGEDGGDSAG